MLESINLTVADTTNSNVPVADALVYVYDDTGAVFITQGRTDSSGILSVVLNPDAYLVRVWKPGYSHSGTLITVADHGGSGIQSYTISVAGFGVTAPSSPSLCRLYGDFSRLDGTALSGARITVKNLFDPSAGFRVLEATKDYATNSSGHVEFDIVRGTRLRVSIPGTTMSRDITVPNATTADLTTLLSQGTDNFTVVT